MDLGVLVRRICKKKAKIAIPLIREKDWRGIEDIRCVEENQHLYDGIMQSLLELEILSRSRRGTYALLEDGYLAGPALNSVLSFNEKKDAYDFVEANSMEGVRVIKYS